MLKAVYAFGLLVVVASPALATVTLQDRQEAACYGDVQKLCGDFVPDVPRTEACMSQMKDRVSAKCRAFYTE